MDQAIHIGAEVEGALADGRPVVALETTLVAHGLPRPDNLRVASELEAAVRAEGAVPATIAVIEGTAMVGLDAGQLERIARGDDVAKLSERDLALAVACGRDGATTVAATAALAALAGIRLFATGGLGGVHRGARESWDESADLVALSRTQVTVVCAGVKSILDVRATLERLETLGVPVVGYRTRRFPGFYLSDSGHPLDWSVDDEGQVAAVMAAQGSLGPTGLVVANPVPPELELGRALHDRVLAEGLAAAEREGVRGKAVTPFLLGHFERATSGASLEVNRRIVMANARLAARIARAFAERRPRAAVQSGASGS